MKSNRLWLIGTAIAVVAIVMLGWILGVSPKLSEAATAAQAADQIDAQNAVTQQEIAALQKAFENIDEVREQLDELGESVPSSADLPDFIRQLNAIGSLYGVSVTSISTGSAFIYAPSAVSAQPEVAAATALVAGSDFVVIPVTIKVSGTYASVLNFTRGLQAGERLFLVTSLSVVGGATPEAVAPARGQEPVASERSFSGEVSGQIYVVLDPNAPIDVEDVEDEVNPTPTATPTATPTPTATATP